MFWWYLLVFWLGASVGSFLNVLINRTVQGEKWVRGRSRCDYCRRELGWYEMIPLVSWVVYGGKSRCCGKKLSLQHPIVEGLVGLLFVWWGVLGAAFFRLVSEPGASIQPLFWLVTGVILAAIGIADLYYGVIPVSFVAVGSTLVLIYRIVLFWGGLYQGRDLLVALVSAGGVSLFYLLLRAITRGRGMGEGDVILALYLGLLLGWPRIGVATLVAFVIGAAVGVALLLAKKRKWRETVPFGPFMVMGAGLALVWSEPILRLFGWG